MKNEILLSAIGNISDELILKADNMQVSKRKRIIKYIATAACFAVIISVVVFIIPEKESDLPMLTVPENDEGAMGFGYEGFMAYDISDLTNSNPWNENAKLSTLPVYKNLYTYDENGLLPTNSAEYAENLLAGVREKTKNMSGIKVERSLGGLEIDIEFVPEKVIEKKYNFSFQSSLEELTQVGTHFIDEYKNIIDMKEPIINIYHGDYNIYGEQLYNMFIYEGKGDLTEQIINYHFNRVHFHPDDNGRLCRIRIDKINLSHKMGEYPIIDCREAEKLLFDGKYITTVPYKLSDNDSVLKTELVYRNGGTEKYYMPYYKFYIEVPKGNLKNNLKDFGTYYVPAVESQYISNMPVWDGNFN